MMLGSTFLIQYITPEYRFFKFISYFAQFVLIDVLYSFYAYNLKLRTENSYNLQQRVMYIDNRLFYFIGFGSIFSGLCFASTFAGNMFGSVLSNFAYSMLFPVLIGFAFYNHPSDFGHNRVPFVQFYLNILGWINELLTNVFRNKQNNEQREEQKPQE